MKVTIKINKTLDTDEIELWCFKESNKTKQIEKYIQNMDRTFTVKGKNGSYLIQVSEIYYFESVDKKTFVYTENEVLETSLKLYEIEENERIKSILNLLIYGLALYGGIMLLAFIFSQANGREVVVLGFFRQTAVYVCALTLWVMLAFTEIIPLKITILQRLAVSTILLYIVTLLGFRNTAMNPFQDVFHFLILTGYFIFMIFMACAAWYLFRFSTSKNIHSFWRNIKRI